MYLHDATLAENIAFGINKKDINFENLETLIEQASLKDFIDSLPEGLNTKVLFFDEVTSALDP